MKIIKKFLNNVGYSNYYKEKARNCFLETCNIDVIDEESAMLFRKKSEQFFGFLLKFIQFSHIDVLKLEDLPYKESEVSTLWLPLSIKSLFFIEANKQVPNEHLGKSSFFSDYFKLIDGFENAVSLLKEKGIKKGKMRNVYLFKDKVLENEDFFQETLFSLSVVSSVSFLIKNKFFNSSFKVLKMSSSGLEMDMKVSEPIEHSWSNIRQSLIETFSSSNENSFLKEVSKKEGWIEEWLGTVEKNNILEELNVLGENSIKKQTKVLRF